MVKNIISIYFLLLILGISGTLSENLLNNILTKEESSVNLPDSSTGNASKPTKPVQSSGSGGSKSPSTTNTVIGPPEMLSAGEGSRTIGEKKYRDGPKSKQDSVSLGNVRYTAAVPKSNPNDEDPDETTDDIVDKTDFKQSEGVSIQGGRKVKENSRKNSKKSSSESAEETTPKPGPKRSRKNKRITAKSAESMLKFVEESERALADQNQSQNPSKGKASRGRSFDKKPNSDPTNIPNLPKDVQPPTAKVDSIDKETDIEIKKSKNKRKKIRNWWKQLMFDADFLSELNSKSGSGSSENNKIIWMDNKNKGSPSVLIIPQKIYDIDYKVYREGNRQENIYNTNITPTSDGKTIKVVQNPVQISKDHITNDRTDELTPTWTSASNDSYSSSSESPKKSNQSGRSMNASNKGETLSDLINRSAAEKNQKEVENGKKSETEDEETVQKFKDKFKGSKRKKVKSKSTVSPKSFETETLPSTVENRLTTTTTQPGFYPTVAVLEVSPKPFLLKNTGITKGRITITEKPTRLPQIGNNGTYKVTVTPMPPLRNNSTSKMTLTSKPPLVKTSSISKITVSPKPKPTSNILIKPRGRSMGIFKKTENTRRSSGCGKVNIVNINEFTKEMCDRYTETIEDTPIENFSP